MSLTKVTYAMIDGASANVLDYGADPTGIADSTAAIQAAIDAAPYVYFPAGEYYVASSVNVRPNSTLVGEGFLSNTSKIRLANGITFVGTANFQVRIDFTQCVNVCIEKLGFYGVGASVISELSTDRFYYVNWNFRDCWFGWSLKNCIQGAFVTSNFVDNRFGMDDGLTKNANHSNVELIYTPYSENNVISIIGNRFESAVDNSLYAENGFMLDVVNNAFQANDCAITLRGLTGAYFRNNYWERNTTNYFFDLAGTVRDIYSLLRLENNYFRQEAVGMTEIVNITDNADKCVATFVNNYMKVTTTPFYLTNSSFGTDVNIGFSLNNFVRDNYAGDKATNYINGSAHPTVHQESAQVEVAINKYFEVLTSAASTKLGNWSARSDINTLVGGSNFGSILESNTGGQCIVGLRINDSNDTFAIVSNSGGAAAGTYDTLVFQARPNGQLKIAVPSNYADDTAAAAGGIAIGGIYRNGSVLQVRVS